MTRSRMASPPEVESISPTRAIQMLLHGLMSPDDIAQFKPAKVTTDSLARILQGSDRIVNRRVSIPTVQRYARDMSTNHWHWTGDPIKVSTEGYVLDGQHRLLAVIESRTTQRFAVVRNMSSDTQLVVDIGRPRSGRDQALLRGHANATNAAAAAKLLLRWRAKRILDNSFIPSIPEIMELLESPEGDLIQLGIQQGMKVRSQLRYAPMSALVVWFVEASRMDVTARDQFITQLIDGVDMSKRDPIHTLRQTIIRYDPQIKKVRSGQAGHLWQIIRAWNGMRKNEELQHLRVPSTLTSANFISMV